MKVLHFYMMLVLMYVLCCVGVVKQQKILILLGNLRVLHYMVQGPCDVSIVKP
jgi:hypothetical protein